MSGARGSLALASLLVVAVPLAGAERPAPAPSVVVLGTAQDGGYPQAGCAKSCCARAVADPAAARAVAALGVLDGGGRRWLVDATPDFRAQLRALDALAVTAVSPPALAGILLTHAHIGHYLGLAQLGREVLGAAEVPLWAMPRMTAFLESNGPWDQLVRLKNVALRPLADGVAIELAPGLTATPFLVPHRDEYSETVGFVIAGPRRRVAWLPDIDKWERWATPLEALLARVDRAYLDGTFYADGELSRPMAEIPHPFITESLARLQPLPAATRAKVRFIHLNHSNPALDPASAARRAIEAAGCAVAEQGERYEL